MTTVRNLSISASSLDELKELRKHIDFLIEGFDRLAGSNATDTHDYVDDDGTLPHDNAAGIFWASPYSQKIADTAAQYGITLRNDEDTARRKTIRDARDKGAKAVNIEAFEALMMMTPEIFDDTMRAVSSSGKSDGKSLRAIARFLNARYAKGKKVDHEFLHEVLVELSAEKIKNYDDNKKLAAYLDDEYASKVKNAYV